MKLRIKPARTPFERFLARYDPDENESEAPLQLADGFVASGFDELMSRFSGCTFHGGLYRLHDQATGDRANSLVTEAFPEFSRPIFCFGFDWLGRQFALDSNRREAGESLVLMFEVGTGEVLEIPATFSGFHDEELVDFADAALAIEGFESWAAETKGLLPLLLTKCVGYRVPLFTGGSDTSDNFEVIDLDVYWTITGQLRRRAVGL